MNILKKLVTALRGSVREVGESIVDANGVKIFEQEIKDAQESLEKAKRDLTGVMAKRMQIAREIASIKSDVSKNEGFAAQALEKGDESLAMDVAKKIAQLESDLSDRQKAHDSFDGHVNRLKGQIKKAERSIKDYERQLSVVKTTDSVQKATAAISDTFTNTDSSLLGAKESIERIKARQQDTDDRLVAAEELTAEDNDAALETKLQAAGIADSETSNAEAILARIKAKKS